MYMCMSVNIVLVLSYVSLHVCINYSTYDTTGGSSMLGAKVLIIEHTNTPIFCGSLMKNYCHLYLCV